MSQIIVNNVQKVFKTPGKDVIALKDIQLDIQAGEFVCLLGPSACGKSTLLNAVAGFALPSSGEITVEGKKITGPSLYHLYFAAGSQQEIRIFGCKDNAGSTAAV